ncbi:MAG TPA: type II toxin-antitoxin system VapC family toxin [Caulobacteraceae bacterium]|nr:type II toxin-antitoxin system VapC family toxin [Caulobacteraceae bacterium]
MTLALDASMTIAWLFADERTAQVETVMLRVVDEGAVVPSLWRLEVANVLRGAWRRGRCDRAYADRSLRRLDRMPITTDDQTDLQAWGAIWELALDEQLTLYDAAYLELALRLQLPLASGDVALCAAASRRGLEVLPP